jgi:hypothetical protein
MIRVELYMVWKYCGIPAKHILVQRNRNKCSCRNGIILCDSSINYLPESQKIIITSVFQNCLNHTPSTMGKQMQFRQLVRYTVTSPLACNWILFTTYFLYSCADRKFRYNYTGLFFRKNAYTSYDVQRLL